MDRVIIGAEGWELCDRRDCTGCDFMPSQDAWTRTPDWLRRFKSDAIAMGALRRLCAHLGSEPAESPSDETTLKEIARALRSGRLHLCRIPRSAGSGGAEPEEEIKRKPAPPPRFGAKTERRRKKTWVEFAVIDAEGNPVSGLPFLVMLPDGSLQEGTLDKTGKVRFGQIDPDNSVFSLPSLDREGWERVD